MENGEKSELGEDTFYNWVNHTLNSDRDNIKTGKEIRSDAGMENQFIRPDGQRDADKFSGTNW